MERARLIENNVDSAQCELRSMAPASGAPTTTEGLGSVNEAVWHHNKSEIRKSIAAAKLNPRYHLCKALVLVGGMTCTACSGAVEKALRNLNGASAICY
eukprot:645223-Prorocentrum_minimum.AAC.2